MSAAQERDVTTVQITRTVHRQLHDLKGYGQSFDELIADMVNVYESER